MGSGFGFILGAIIGSIFAAFCYKNKGRFFWSKYIGRTPATDSLQENQPRHDKGGPTHISPSSSPSPFPPLLFSFYLRTV